jgi:GNAT superfamily N-acetyltransferase
MLQIEQHKSREYTLNMFKVKTMSPQDFEFAVKITEPMEWGLTKSDFEFMIELEPEGCFVLFDDSERIGIATTVSYGKVGWFGNLIVSPGKRKKGGGSLLVKHAIKYLADRNVETVGLYAYFDKIPFYTQLGFKYDSEFSVLKGKNFPSPILCNVKEARKQDVKKVIDYDETCFGASRKKLLKPILLYSSNFCYMLTENNKVTGFIVAKVYDCMAELGPLICKSDRDDIAINLVNATLNRLEGFEVSICIPKKEKPIINMLKKSSFNENFRVARMFFGPCVTNKCTYIAESLERG